MNFDNVKNLYSEKITKQLLNPADPIKLIAAVVIISGIIGILSGFSMSKNGGSGGGLGAAITGASAPKTAQQDNRTFRDFAEGTLKVKPAPKNPNQYSEGTHVLERTGAVPVALTSSVVDLTQFEGKKVKVFGETQKALKEGWLMDVGKVEEAQ